MSISTGSILISFTSTGHARLPEGHDWAEVLHKAKQQGLSLSVVVKDAALGIEAKSIEAVMPLYREGRRVRARYDVYRAFARRD